MRITALKATVVRERVFWAHDVQRTVRIAPPVRSEGSQPSLRMPIPGSVLVEVGTDAGLVGLGLGGGGVPGAFVVETYLSPLLRGRDASDPEALWERMYHATIRYGQAGIVLMAISGIDLALWDLKGKALEQPVYSLIGGKAKERVPVYATSRDPAWTKAQGFAGLKLGSPYGPPHGREGMRKNEAFVASVRDLLGPDIDLMIDCSRRWNVEYTLDMAQILAPYRIAFIEEPLPPYDMEGYGRLCGEIDTTLIATGEHLYTRHAFGHLLAWRGADIIQPDIRWTGGLSEMIRICDLAAKYNVPVMPHRGGMAWSFHLIMARENCPLAEGLVLTEAEGERSVFAGEPVPVDGHLAVSDAPGFGLSLRREVIDEFAGET